MSLAKERGISISKLEKECDIGHATIAKWDKSAPTLTSLKKIADYFGITVCELLDEDET